MFGVDIGRRYATRDTEMGGGGQGGGCVGAASHARRAGTWPRHVTSTCLSACYDMPSSAAAYGGTSH